MVTNKMTVLLNKIERRLGTKTLNLPKELQKSEWVQVIEEESLSSFSNFFPNLYRAQITDRNKKDDEYILDESVIPKGVDIIGIKDIAWDDLNSGLGATIGNIQNGYYDQYNNIYNIEDIISLQLAADFNSFFNNGIYIETTSNNTFRLKNAMGVCINNINNFKIDILVKHSINLNTIPPTQMEDFENLAIADVATFLYNELKYYDNSETICANIDLKLDEMRKYVDMREQIIQMLKDGCVSVANKNQPMIMTI